MEEPEAKASLKEESVLEKHVWTHADGVRYFAPGGIELKVGEKFTMDGRPRYDTLDKITMALFGWVRHREPVQWTYEVVASTNSDALQGHEVSGSP